MKDHHWKPRSGANIVAGGVRFEVWAPKAVSVDLVLDGSDQDLTMDHDGRGCFSVTVPGAGAGARYRLRVDGAGPFPDPYSRFQPDGVHGASEIIDPGAFAWSDDGWRGLVADGQVIYELHVGTMTPDGTFASLIGELDALVELGVTAVELMPVAQCPGRWNWGYDGVAWFAPFNAYGRPDDLRRFVDAAHARGIGVILDVVYNHLGPEGNYLGIYADAYFTDRHQTPWGDGLNWDGPDSTMVRRFATDNACSWIAEYHIDGLRLDATHALVDDSPVHIVRELTEAARFAAGNRSIVVYAEDGRHEISRARPVARAGEGVDGIWADEFHHELRVLLTNAHENYYAAYAGSISGLATTIEDGFDQRAARTGQHAGSTVTDDDPASAFVFCIQNHDQVGNRPFGDRLHHEINRDRYLVASCVLLFAPETPLLFMGQEFAASTPFLYFTDHPAELGRLVTEGRRREFTGFGVFADDALRETIPDPQAETTFVGSKLRLDERESKAGVLSLYRTMIGLRRNDPVLRVNDRTRTCAIPLSAQALGIRRWTGDGTRLLIANFGAEHAVTMADPGCDGMGDIMLMTTAAPYGTGDPTPAFDHQTGVVTVPARSALILGSGPPS